MIGLIVLFVLLLFVVFMLVAVSATGSPFVKKMAKKISEEPDFEIEELELEKERIDKQIKNAIKSREAMAKAISKQREKLKKLKEKI